jgi:hypothetical protein
VGGGEEREREMRKRNRINYKKTEAEKEWASL